MGKLFGLGIFRFHHDEYILIGPLHQVFFPGKTLDIGWIRFQVLEVRGIGSDFLFVVGFLSTQQIQFSLVRVRG